MAEACASGEYAAAWDEVAQACGFAGVDASMLADYAGADADALFHELRRERTRLLVGERKPLITPYVGVWAAQQRGQRGSLMIGAESMAIERFMRARGVAKNLAAGQSNDPVDHIGTVCEFMQFLCLVNARAVAPAEGVVVEEGDFEAFLRQHFATYAQWFGNRMAEEAHSAFYQVKGAQLQALSQLV